MASTVETLATLDDLARVVGKAELVAGRIVHLMPTGRKPSRAAFRIARSLDDHATATGIGEAFADNTGFVVPELVSGRRSFSPDAAYHLGPFPADPMRFLPGAPAFAIEVRSEIDYGPAAEAALAAKRTDYFEAGTRVVWDVDPVAEVIRSYGVGSPEAPPTFKQGDVAHAEPAVVGWRLAVVRIFV